MSLSDIQCTSFIARKVNSFWILAAYSCQHFWDWKITTYGIEGEIHLRQFSYLKFDAK
jgi:hypothetical protein